jgi:hypothetical protein
MSDRIIKAVARRWKQASDATWLTETSDLSLESALQYSKEDRRRVKGYLAKCAYLAPIYRNLAGPLESPILIRYADLMDKRALEVGQLMVLVNEGASLFKKADDEFGRLIENLAAGKPHRGLIEAVYDLPTIKSIMKIANEASKIHDRLIKEDDDMIIDWVLEEYVGPEAGIHRKLDKAGDPMRGWFAGGSDFSGVGTLYGFVKYFTDPKYIQDSIDDIRAERGTDE